MYLKLMNKLRDWEEIKRLPSNDTEQVSRALITLVLSCKQQKSSLVFTEGDLLGDSR